jgi:hypothetical protein
MDGRRLAKWGIFFLATWTVASNLDATDTLFLMILEILGSQPGVI